MSCSRSRGAALLLALLVVACGEPPPPSQAPRPVEWVRVGPAIADLQRRLAGTVQPVQDAALAFEVGGEIDRIEVEVGDRVQAGDPLASLDPEPYRLAEDDARARLAEAEAEAVLAREQHDRIAELRADSLVSAQRYDESAARLETARAAVRAAQAAVALAGRDLEQTRLKAPFAGSVSARHAEPYEEVAAGRPVLHLDAQGALEVAFRVPPPLLRTIAPGAPVTLRLPALDAASGKGRVRDIGRRAGPGESFPVTVTITAAPAGLRPGMSAEVVLASTVPDDRNEPLYRVPAAGVVAGEGSQGTVFRLAEDGETVRAVAVRVIDFQDRHTLVGGPLSPQDRIVASGAAFLSDGQAVRALPRAGRP